MPLGRAESNGRENGNTRPRRGRMTDRSRDLGIGRRGKMAPMLLGRPNGEKSERLAAVDQLGNPRPGELVEADGPTGRHRLRLGDRSGERLELLVEAPG